MVIRCERCSTLYELDDALLAPEGSPVQCTRCQHVFTAVPPRAQAQAAAAPPREPERAEPPRGDASRDDAAPATPSTSSGASTSAADSGAPASSAPAAAPAPAPARPANGPRPPVHDARVPRGTTPAVYRPPASPSPAVSAPPRAMIRRDTLGAFESRLRWSARVKWLVPAVILAIAVAAAGGWWLWSRRGGDPEADRLREEGLALLARDDRRSVDAAVTQLDAALARKPRATGPAADRILAIAVRGQSMAEAAEVASTRAAERNAERERLRRDAATGWEEAERNVAADEARLRTLAGGMADRARAAADEATAGLRALEDARASGPEVARATAAVRALSGDRAALAQALETGRTVAVDDPWLAVVAAGDELRSGEEEARTRAAAELSAVAQRRPDLLRAQVLLARAQAGLGKRTEALATVGRVLSVNPQHEGAQALHAMLVRPSESVAVTPPAPAAGPSAGNGAAPAAGNAAAPPRKPLSQPAPLARPIPAPAPGPATAPAVPFAGAPTPEPTPAAAEHPPATPAAPVPAPVEEAPPPRPAPPAVPAHRPSPGTVDSQGSSGG